jgi:uncharacterized repeat protein (TIGR01451 family)
MNLPRTRALSAALVGTGFATALVLGATAIPAQAAAEKHADLYVKVIGDKMSAKTASKYFYVQVGNRGSAAATGAKATFDFSKGAAGYTYEAERDDPGKGTCSTGQHPECALGTLQPGQVETLLFIVKGAPDAPVGSAGSVTVAVTPQAGDAHPADNKQTVQISVVPAGVDLTTYAGLWTGSQRTNRVKAGDKDKIMAGIAEQGYLGVHPEAVTVTIQVPTSAAIVERYQDCTYQNDWYGAARPAGTAYGPSTVTCTIPWLTPSHGMVLAGKGGELFTVAFGSNLDGPAYKDIKLSAQPAALPKLPDCALTKPATCDTVAGRIAQDLGLTLPTGSGSGKPAVDIEPADNDTAFQIVTDPNPADLAVTADKATGKVGDTVQVMVNVKNKGPADAPSWRADLTAPKGTRFVGVSDAACGTPATTKPAATLVCNHPKLLPVSTGTYANGVSFTVALKIEAADVGADGLVVVSQPGTEKNAADNKARIEVDLPGAGGTGGGTGSGGAPPGGGSLPVTGGQVALLATAGAGVLAIGAVLFVAARRRRVALVIPNE